MRRTVGISEVLLGEEDQAVDKHSPAARCIGARQQKGTGLL